MRDRLSLLSDIAAALESRGWTAQGDPNGVVIALDEPVIGGVVRIRLTFDPQRIWMPPFATLEAISGEPKDFALHRFGGTFCYLAPDSVEWNPESGDFIGNVIWAAERVVSELHRMQRGKSIAREDSEFRVHWAGHSALIDIADADWPPPAGARLERLDFPRPEFSADPLMVFRLKNASPSARFASLGSPTPQLLVAPVTAKLQKYPFPSVKSSPPRTLADLNPWLIAHDPVGNKKLWSAIANSIYPPGKPPSNAFILLDTLAGRFGALLVVDDDILGRFRRGSSLAEHLHGVNSLTASISLIRWTFERLDSDFVLGRNAPEERPVLADRRIHLLGAGAVGAQLADLLVQAGAGAGTGSLHIFDGDTYRTENSGRHLLGVAALGLKKAEALVSHLKRQRLAGNVFARPVFAGDPALHRDAELVIDATSAPYLGALLSNVARRQRSWALLSAFVEGEGWVAGAYLYGGTPGEACRDCLEPWIGGKGSHIRKERQHRPRDNGCGGSFTPYRAAAATIAAALASELACDWALKKPSSRFRTMRMPNAPGHVAPSRTSSPVSKPGCICAQTVKVSPVHELTERSS